MDQIIPDTMTTSQQYCLRWNNHRSNLLSVFEQLLHDEAFTDVTIAAESGRTVKCHKIVLAACSTYFQNLFHGLQDQHPIIILKDAGFPEIQAILEYMYRGEVNVAQNQLPDLLKIAQVLKVKGLVEEHGSQSNTARDLRREDTSMEPSISPPPAISTSTGGGSGGSHSSPPHSTGGYSGLYGKSAVSLDRVQSHPLAGSLPITWPLPLHSAGAGHQLPTSLSSSVLVGGPGAGGYDNGIETSPLKRRKPMQPSSALLMNHDTPILRTVLGQAHVDSSQTMPLLQPDSHESVHYRNASSNGSANDSDNRRSNDLSHGEAVHADVSYMDEDERQPSPQSYGGDTARNTAAPDCVPQKPEWKRYKQYTREDILSAIEAVKTGMSAVAAARRYGVPSRTLYDKVKKLGIPTSRPFRRSTSNGGSTACFPYGIGANANGALYDNNRGGVNALSENENESGSSNINVIESLAGTSAAAVFETTYAKATKDTSQDRDSMSDSMTRCSASPVIRCSKQKQQQQQQQDLDDQVEDLSVSRKSDVPVIIPPSTTSVAIKDEAQEAGLDSNDCCDYS
ncbi:longitudinals lacking protein, isoforms H/M/V-like [Temnothorax curvispinosus]|uniref:Longitudinals lacking protein, isoforms H/M/V-like n=1 Tax=Temnothorax curvispinosus TaxID=300111 RepID=A0A6J1PU54_9HYME|nr:longitudinals lacking protein, isoforms H/M/V-like [Temnothorax curvispinosus]XP_024872405.1 longitudinals lacking protein, isoforms H/M/V-like [Temnothorax curvispinosus]